MLHRFAGKQTSGDQTKSPWTGLGRELEEYVGKLTDERLQMLYEKLFAAGWAKPVPMPLSSRNADLHIMEMVMKTVSIECIERREGRIPSVK